MADFPNRKDLHRLRRRLPALRSLSAFEATARLGAANTPADVAVTVGQLARRQNVPWRRTGSHAPAKFFDAQSGLESGMTLMTGATAGANLMPHSCGWDEGGARSAGHDLDPLLSESPAG